MKIFSPSAPIMLLVIALLCLAATSLSAQDLLYVSATTAERVSLYNSAGATLADPFINTAPRNSNYGMALGNNVLYVAQQGQDRQVGAYNALTGVTINASLVSNVDPIAVKVAGNILYVSNGTTNSVGTYNATTGAVINSQFITGAQSTFGIALGNNVIYTVNEDSGTVGAFNLSTGVAINRQFISGLNIPFDAVAFGNTLLVADSGNHRVGAYDATTGAVINASFITSTDYPSSVAVKGNTLYVLYQSGSGQSNSSISAYDATTGAVINASVVSEITQGFNLVVGVPEPSTWMLVLITVGVLLITLRARRQLS